MAFLSLALLAAALPCVLADDTAVAESENWNLCKDTLWTWAAIIIVTLIYRWTLNLLHHVRRIANLNHGTSADSKQRYFSLPNETWASIKRHIISAPLYRKRHTREFKLSAAVNVGTLPSRIQTLLLVVYFGMNVALCAVHIDWSDVNVFYDDAVMRTGCIAALNTILLFFLAGRNNPLVWLLGIKFDVYNLIHRWVGRIAVFEALCHGIFYMAGQIHHFGVDSGLNALRMQLAIPYGMVITGTIGISALIVILLSSPSIVRHAFYETFLHVHVVLVIVVIIAIWIHLIGTFEQTFLLVGIICWIMERLQRFVSLVRRNTGNGVTKAEVEALPGDAVRITLRVAKPWKFKPGQHVYMYMPSVGLWTSHPFSLAWSQEAETVTGGKELPIARQDILSTKTISMSLIIRRRTGFTDKLWNKAERSAGGKFMTTAFVEGPYGNQNFQSYGTVMLFAAGVGITHQVPHVRDLVAAYANGTCATRKVVLVWIIRSPEHLEWIRPWMTQILSMEKRRDILKILLFVTRPRSTKEIHSPNSSVQMFPGKPDVGALIEKEQSTQVGAMVISVCGTGSLSDDVRKAMRYRCKRTEIDFSEEAFSW